VQVFAVDLEAHSVFAYNAMPCLLQVAVGSRCFAVDLLALHDCVSILKEPFEDGRVLKLFHGCIQDMQWLQQLGIYCVNVLDTCLLAEVSGSIQILLLILAS
jgi:ribonuclease D